ncbi:MAG: hypothetical protein AAF401_09640 [Pseudomonadota bacterium]
MMRTATFLVLGLAMLAQGCVLAPDGLRRQAYADCKAEAEGVANTERGDVFRSCLRSRGLVAPGG